MNTISRLPFLVVIDPAGYRAEAESPEEIILAAMTLLDEARAHGSQQPYARLYGDGWLVRDRVTRTDLAAALGGLGRCWCGRGALYGLPGTGWCSHAHAALWGKMTRLQRAKVIVARFMSIYGDRYPQGGPSR